MFKRQYFTFEKPIAANYDTPSGVSCIQVYYPDDIEHLYVLQGLMAALTKPDFWDGTEAEIDYRAYLWEVAYETTNWSDCEVATMPGLMSRVTLWHMDAEVTVNDAGNAIAISHDAGADFAHYAQQNPPTLNSQSSQLVRLQAGSWKMRMLYHGLTSSGKCQLYWLKADFSDSGAIGAELDMYADGFNQIHTGTFTIPDDGDYRITWSNTGRNVANLTPFYRMMITKTELWRTGA